MNDAVLRLIRHVQGIVGLRRSDIILASFPKSGNTWIRFFFCNLISLLEWEGRVVNFNTLDATMPELGVDNLLKPWPYKCIPRIVKTHQKYWRIFARSETKIYVIRDPRDVMVSLFKMLSHMKQVEIKNNFSDFIRDPKWGLGTWFDHYLSWVDRAGIVLRYEDLREADAAEFSRIMEALNISVSRDILSQAVERSSFDSVRQVESKFGIPKAENYREGFRFTRSGKSGGWREYFNSEDISYYESLKDRYKIDLY